MATPYEPLIGDWYITQEGGSFEVIAVDPDEAVVEIQYFDGAIEELDMESWYAMEIKPREAPEDWSGPFDDLEKDDFGDTEQARHPDEWSNPLDSLDWEKE
ncbi:MAG TPA: DUF6763 family protein [Gammaproteobacteria bacterium]